MKKIFQHKFIYLVLAVLFLAAAAVFQMPASHAEQSGAISIPIMKITPQTPANALKSLADDDLVELPSGRKIVMRDIRMLSHKMQKIKTATPIGKPIRQVFQVQPALSGIALKNRADLVSALSRPDTDTVQLPSGRRLTVEQLRFLQPYVEKRLGRKLTSLEPPKLKGTAIKIQSTADKNYWRNILQKPDDTVIESPDGTRITVGDLKAALSSTKTPGSSSPRVSP